MTDVLEALKINSTTFPVYQASGAPQYPLQSINNMILVKDPQYATGWGWFEEEEFHTYYKWVNPAPQSFTAFSEIEKLETDDS